MSGDFETLAANDIGAEQAVLGSMMLARAALSHCLETLTPAAFYRPAHQLVFEAIAALEAAGTPVDALTVKAELDRTGATGRIGGAPYLHTLLAAVPTSANAPHYAARLLDMQCRRATDELGMRVRQIAASAGLTPEERVERIYEATDQMTGTAARSTRAVTAADLFCQTVDRLQAGRPAGTVQFPWIDMRELVPWMRPGQLITIAARPSVGKSVLGQDIARHVAMEQGLPCALFTMEMSRDEVMDRLIAAEAGVPLFAITNDRLEEHDWTRIAKAAPRFSESRLVIDDTPQVSLAAIRSRLRTMQRGEAAHVAIIDYLQLMEGAGGESRQREVSGLVAGLKAIARDFGIPVVMLCQLNRGPEGRADKRPFMSDARESGAVENDSDIVVLIHREDFYDRESPRAGEADLIVDKNRNGPRTTVTVAFQGHYARFVDMANILDPAPKAADWTPSSVIREAS